MDPISTIGSKLGEDAARDAIHIAIVPIVVGGSDLAPGERVRVSHISGKAMAWKCYEDEPHDGIVDPYLSEPVKEGDRFWLFLIPGTIVGLRHDWTHPAFPSTSASAAARESEDWLRNYARRYAANYDEMLAGAVNGDGYCFGDDDGPPNYRGAVEEFWRHIENVTGKRFSDSHRENTVFRCGC